MVGIPAQDTDLDEVGPGVSMTAQTFFDRRAGRVEIDVNMVFAEIRRHLTRRR